MIFWSTDSTCLSLRAGSRRDEEEGSGGEGKVNSNLLHNIMKREGRRRFHLLYYPNEHFLSPTNWGVEEVTEFCHPYLPSAASFSSPNIHSLCSLSNSNFFFVEYSLNSSLCRQYAPYHYGCLQHFIYLFIFLTC